MEAMSSGGFGGSAKRQKVDTQNNGLSIGEPSLIDSLTSMSGDTQVLPPSWPYNDNVPDISECSINMHGSQWTGSTDTSILDEGISTNDPNRQAEDSFLSLFPSSLDPQTSLIDPALDTSDWKTIPLSSSHSTNISGPTQQQTRKRRLTVNTHPPENSTSLSIFSIDQSMLARSNQGMISHNLLRIYHDVLEHSLSCWLTEATCPYQLNGGDYSLINTQSEWGSSWSNRLYRGILKLDRAAKSTKLIRISASEDQACERALHLAIMAFATQWTQSSRRHNSFDQDSHEGDFEDDTVDEFDRSLQWHFWTQAERALQDVAHIESFRVFCAEAVFGLAQKPWFLETVQTSTSRFEEESLMFQIAQDITRDGPPMYLERAARKMHTLKFKFDSALRDVSRQRDSGIDNTAKSMSQEDKTMVGLVYWLSIMLDTVSSSMNERPVVIPDQDSQHAGCISEDADDAYWNVELFIQDKLEAPCHTIRWPCTYEVAANAVTRSAPVKVLLYRHVSYLQNTLRRGQSSLEKTEKIIQKATSLYRYWNLTYGVFFRDLLQNFDSVPGRIQSWFVCISAHWHLACLILADLINTVDQNDLGVKSSTQMRRRSRFVAKMQETSVKELSELARITTPPSEKTVDDFCPGLSGFHPCVSEGTILTEPWTAILIRAFSRAAVWLLEDVEDCGRYGLGPLAGEGSSETLKQAEYCIKGLWFLGKKSDMARRVANTLTRALSNIQN